jgi:hypothetical protein
MVCTERGGSTSELYNSFLSVVCCESHATKNYRSDGARPKVPGIFDLLMYVTFDCANSRAS